MRVLAALVQHQLKVTLHYRSTLLFSAVLHPIVMLLTMLVFRGIYSARQADSLLGYALPQMVWYFGATHFFYYLVWNEVDKTVCEQVLQGRADAHFLRPYSMLGWSFAQLSAQKLLGVLFEFVPVFLLYCVIVPPDFLTSAGLLQYLLLTGVAFIQLFLMSFTVASAALVWGDVSGLVLLKQIVVQTTAGLAVPIAFYPESLQALVLSLPFHNLFHTPVGHLLGTLNPSWSAFAQRFAEQTMFAGVLLLGAIVVHRHCAHRFVSAGG